LATVGRSAPSLLALVLLSCGGPPRDPVEALLHELEEAAEARDLDRVVERLSATFEGQGNIRKADAQAMLRRYFAGYETIRLDVYGVEQERDGGAARVRCVADFSGQAQKAFGLEGLLPPSAVYRFDLEARDEAGTWRLVRASWEVVEGPKTP
jgi:hypothetical protein